MVKPSSIQQLNMCRLTFRASATDQVRIGHWFYNLRHRGIHEKMLLGLAKQPAEQDAGDSENGALMQTQS